MDTNSKKKKLLSDLADICCELNWVIGIPKESLTAGLICGNKEYVEENCLKIYGKDNYEIISEESAIATANKSASESLVTSDNKNDYDVVELTEQEFEKFLATGDLPDSIQLVGDPTKVITYH